LGRQPSFEDRGFGAIALCHPGRVRLDLMAAIPNTTTISRTRVAAALPSVIGGPAGASPAAAPYRIARCKKSRQEWVFTNWDN